MSIVGVKLRKVVLHQLFYWDVFFLLKWLKILKGGIIIMMAGRFGKYGGQYVPEIVMPVLTELVAAYDKYEQAKAAPEKKPPVKNYRKR